jgi:hypothetical protein
VTRLTGKSFAERDVIRRSLNVAYREWLKTENRDTFELVHLMNAAAAVAAREVR